MTDHHDTTMLPALPQGWAWTTLGQITEAASKVNPGEKPDDQFFYLDISSIDNTTNRITDPKIYLGKDAPSRARQLVQAADVLFSTVRTYLKNIALVPPQYDAQIASTGFAVLRGVGDVPGKYIFYFTLTNDFLEKLGALQRGVSYPAVREGDVREQFVPLAPLAEQRRIVEAIEALFTQLDAGVAALKRAQRQVQRYKASVLKAACEGRLVPQDPTDEPAAALLRRILAERRAAWKGKGKYQEPAGPDTEGLPELPEGWVWVSVEQVGIADEQAVLTGPFGSNLGRDDFISSGVPVLTIGCLTEQGLTLGKAFYISEAKAAELDRYRVRESDLLFSRMASVGRAGLGMTIE